MPDTPNSVSQIIAMKMGIMAKKNDVMLGVLSLKSRESWPKPGRLPEEGTAMCQRRFPRTTLAHLTTIC
jgi:hypothetical protein